MRNNWWHRVVEHVTCLGIGLARLEPSFQQVFIVAVTKGAQWHVFCEVNVDQWDIRIRHWCRSVATYVVPIFPFSDSSSSDRVLWASQFPWALIWFVEHAPDTPIYRWHRWDTETRDESCRTRRECCSRHSPSRNFCCCPSWSLPERRGCQLAFGKLVASYQRYIGLYLWTMYRLWAHKPQVIHQRSEYSFRTPRYLQTVRKKREMRGRRREKKCDLIEKFPELEHYQHRCAALIINSAHNIPHYPVWIAVQSSLALLWTPPSCP